MKIASPARSVVWLAFGLLTSAYLLSAHSQASPSTAEDLDGHAIAPREVLIKLRSDADVPTIYAQGDVDTDRALGRSGWHRLRSASKPAHALLLMLRARRDVLAVEPNYVVRAAVLPDDPQVGSLWNFLNPGTPGADIHVTRAWDIVTGSPTIVVGAVDTGIDYIHPDLAANVWSAPTAFTVSIGGTAITCPAGSHGFNAIRLSCDPWDDAGHGTHIAGTIGAVGNNSIGLTGVNWTTRVMALKFLDATGSGTTADAVNAIEFAIQAKLAFASSRGADVRVLSNSWGGNAYSEALSDEIARAAAQDMLFVAAAGNSSSNDDSTPFYPAGYAQSNVIAVAATDRADSLATFSNYGATSVHIAAPGVDIASTWPGGGYATLSGTSMATPHVSGAAALTLAACDLTTSQLGAALLSNVDVLRSLSGVISTGGRLNVDRAVRSCAAAPAVTLAAPADGVTYTAAATIGLSATATSATGIARVEFFAGTTLVATATTPTASAYSATWDGVPTGSYMIRAKAYDLRGLTSTSPAVHVTVASSTAGSAATATFDGVDSTTQGNWIGRYGADGSAIANDAANYPTYVTAAPAGAATWTWSAAPADVRALERAAGDGRIASAWYAPTFSIDLNFSDGSPHAVAVYIVDWDSFGRSERFDIRDASTGAVLDSRTATAFGGGQYFRWTLAGHVTLQVTQTGGGGGAVASGLLFGGARAATATFTGVDATARGNWQGVYGGDGYQIVDDAVRLPSYVVAAETSASQWIWDTASTDDRALQRSIGGGRTAAAWYGSSFSIDLDFVDGATHQVAFYLVDWDSFGRAERFEIRDAATGAILDTETATAFSNGQYWRWTLRGHVTVEVTQVGGGGGAVLGGMFFGTTARATAAFAGTDDSTQGNWAPLYGGDGYQLVGDASRVPSYAGVTATGAFTWTWASASSDVRALARAASTGRVAATWYGGTFSIDLDLPGATAHQVTLYIVDWDSFGRAQRFDIRDAATGAVLDSRTATTFAGGRYFKWNVQGHVIVQVTQVGGGGGAVVSALFFDSVPRTVSATP